LLEVPRTSWSSQSYKYSIFNTDEFIEMRVADLGVVTELFSVSHTGQ